MDEVKKANVAIRKDVHKLVKIFCAQKDKDIGEYISDVLEMAVRSKVLPPPTESRKNLRFEIVT